MPLPKNALKRLSVAFLIVGGVALLLAGAWFGFANITFLQKADRAPGVVTEIVGQRGARGAMLYYPVVRFQPSGRSTGIVFKAKPGLWPSPFDTGDRVVVAYDPDDPDDARIVSFWMLWFLPGIMILFGLGCLFAARDTMKKIV